MYFQEICTPSRYWRTHRSTEHRGIVVIARHTAPRPIFMKTQTVSVCGFVLFRALLRLACVTHTTHSANSEVIVQATMEIKSAPGVTTPSSMRPSERAAPASLLPFLWNEKQINQQLDQAPSRRESISTVCTSLQFVSTRSFAGSNCSAPKVCGFVHFHIILCCSPPHTIICVIIAMCI